MIGQCWIAALRPMRKFGLESGPAKCLSLALVFFTEAKFDVILMFERWEAGEQLEHRLERLSYSTLFAIPLQSFATAFRASGACCSSL